MFGGIGMINSQYEVKKDLVLSRTKIWRHEAWLGEDNTRENMPNLCGNQLLLTLYSRVKGLVLCHLTIEEIPSFHIQVTRD